MVQTFECPNCHASLDFNDNNNQITVRCPYCSSTVIVPDSLRQHTPATPGTRQDAVMRQIVELVANGRKIEAIKLFRETFSVGLKEAKDVIDTIERHEAIHLADTNFSTANVTISTPSSSGCGCTTFILLLIITVGVATALYLGGQLPFVDDWLAQWQNEDGSGIVLPTSDEGLSGVVAQLQTAVPQATATPGFAQQTLQFGGEEGIGPGFFNDTRAIALDGDGNIYTGDYSGGRIQVFDPEGGYVRQLNVGEDLYMVSMTVNRAGDIYLIHSGALKKYSGSSGELLNVLVDFDFSLLNTVANTPDGGMVAVGRDRIVWLDSADNVILDLADPFENVPDFSSIRYEIAVDGASNLYVLGQDAIFKFNKSGQFIDRIVPDTGENQRTMQTATTLAVDGKGRLFIESFDGIAVFNANGRFLTQIPSPGVAFDMRFTDQNELILMDRNSNEVRKYRLNE